MLKRFFVLALALLLVITSFSGCGVSKDNGKINIVCTVFPIYDWARNIIGDNSEDISLHLLIKNGTDPHSYTPSPADVAKLLSCDILIYVGGESDGWVSEVLSGSANKNMKEIKLMEILGERAALDDHEHCLGEDCHDHEHTHSHSEENAYDEHIWLSLKNAALLCDKIGQALSEQIPDRSESFSKNNAEYVDKINFLDQSFEAAIASSPRKTLLFADRFPFRYLTEDYGIEYFAAFSGCSADAEASFETVTRLSKKIDELGLRHVVILENSSTALANTVISGSSAKDAQIVVMNSLQSITLSDIEGGATYLSVMEKNLEAVKSALS